MPRKEKEKGGFDGRDADYRAINLREMGRPAERANERASEAAGYRLMGLSALVSPLLPVLYREGAGAARRGAQPAVAEALWLHKIHA